MLNLFNGKKKFCLAAHSFGSLVAIELAKLLERNGLTGEVVIADGSVALFKRTLSVLMPNMDPSHENVGMFVQAQLAYQFLPEIQPDAIKQIIFEEKSFEARMDKYIGLMKTRDYSDAYLKNMGYGLINRVGMVLREDDVYSGDKIQSNITLIRPQTNLVVDIENDYQLKQYTNGQVFVDFIEGTHLTMLDNPRLYEIINTLSTNKRQN